jgi:hypothetical protein
MVFNATFYNISVISWQSVLLVEETNGEYTEKTTDLLQVTDKLISHNVVSDTPHSDIQTNNVSGDRH